MIFDLINLDKLRRGILYAAILFGVLMVQNLLLARLPLFGVRPLFVPALMVAVGMFEGGLWGGVLGLIAGFFCDMDYAENLVLFTILFPRLGFGTGLLTERTVNRRFFSYCILCLAALRVTALFQAFEPVLFHGAGLFPALRVVLIQTLWSMPFSLPLYFIAKSLSGRQLG